MEKPHKSKRQGGLPPGERERSNEEKERRRRKRRKRSPTEKRRKRRRLSDFCSWKMDSMAHQVIQLEKGEDDDLLSSR